jgi:hypothetical protein
MSRGFDFNRSIKIRMETAALLGIVESVPLNIRYKNRITYDAYNAGGLFVKRNRVVGRD